MNRRQLFSLLGVAGLFAFDFEGQTHSSNNVSVSVNGSSVEVFSDSSDTDGLLLNGFPVRVSWQFGADNASLLPNISEVTLQVSNPYHQRSVESLLCACGFRLASKADFQHVISPERPAQLVGIGNLRSEQITFWTNIRPQNSVSEPYSICPVSHDETLIVLIPSPTIVPIEA
ncbi:MAG: hypothetical protein COT91_00665 [Candidatus Doudnabacteria bacterium CG10_big_fil_rev_8_21_14_0_10_41_10]|uniref:Uncharacterized protein n=1 Tax=Candidatus Doudnabacteria bacterium CG10_big_fil_rev_8_21_14_0_10_41_10 TaxID=1974551 RepID=A0A2H0VEM1_9BACT|nr:MAG: hypothetical protein COT91_00665 [Candidatus Doudnabacteria bacterium CG10_big_fil_rev_8_21_14_0_10_41_10]